MEHLEESGQKMGVPPPLGEAIRGAGLEEVKE